MIKEQQELMTALQMKHQEAMVEAERQREKAEAAQERPDEALVKAIGSGRATQVCGSDPAYLLIQRQVGRWPGLI